MNMKLAAITVAAIATLASTPTAAQVAGAFSQGRTHFVVTAGNGYAFDETYLVIGVGVSYYVIDGLNVGLSVESWTGADPGMTKVTPSLQYVLHQGPLKPYVGGFYRRAYIEGNLPDLDSVGARAGLYFNSGRNAYFGIGAVYESYLDCTKTAYRSCSDAYPELILTIGF